MAKITLNVGVYIEMHVGGTIPVASPPELLGIDGRVTLSNQVDEHDAITAASAPSVEPTVIERDLTAVVNAAPISGGSPPDKIREQHDLPIPRPSYGPRETGSHLFLSDVAAATERKSDTRSDVVAGGRQGVIADGYVFSSEVVNAGPQEQKIAVDRGAIEIDLSGEGKMHTGSMVVTAGTHVASKKVVGDQGGSEYGSVGATYDPGPRGLARPGGGGGLYRDGRPRVSFGNNNRG